MRRLLVLVALVFTLAARAVVAETALAQSCVQRPAGLVSWWPGEGSAEDVVGPNDGIIGPTTSFSQGMVGSAFDTEQGGDVVIVPNSPSLDFPAGSSLTIELWAFLNSPARPQHLIGKRDGCGFAEDDPDFYQVAIGLSAFPPESVPVGEWSHLAVVWDGATNETRHYVNGALVFTDTRGLLGTNSAPLKIGDSGTCGSYGQAFHGRIDEVSLYGRAFSQVEIQGIVDAGSFGKCPTGPPRCSDGIDNDGDNLIDYPADPGCGSPNGATENPQCEDGIDNDGDGLKDASDPGCGGQGWRNSENPACADGIDNDGDGYTDYVVGSYANDTACRNATDQSEGPDCADGIDNDGDGLVDYPADPGCVDNVEWATENPECSDGEDNDRDGKIDFVPPAGSLQDPQCVSALDPREAPDHCGLGAELVIPLGALLLARRRAVSGGRLRGIARVSVD